MTDLRIEVSHKDDGIQVIRPVSKRERFPKFACFEIAGDHLIGWPIGAIKDVQPIQLIPILYPICIINFDEDEVIIQSRKNDPLIFKLKADIESGYRDAHKNRVLYGKKGETVTLISQSDNVMVVKGKDGNRFPVNTIDTKQVFLITK